MNDLTVSEWFGPTLQGEGPSCGRLAAFLRLGLCNLDCSWCDTPYTWDWTGKNGPPQDRAALLRLSVEAVAAQLPALPLTVITGGEPLIQATALTKLVTILGGDIEIETNGTMPPGKLADLDRVSFNVSPKLASSGVHPGHLERALENFAVRDNAVFKFVIADDSDLAEVDKLMDDGRLRRSKVWLMPEGRDADTILAGTRRLAQAAFVRGCNVSTRLHVLLWGDERGR